MTYYHKLGTIPHKRHTQFRKPDGTLYREGLMKSLERRHLVDAGRAPGRPEVQHHHPAAEVLETVKLPLEIREGEIGSGHPHLRAAVLAAGDQQERESDARGDEAPLTHGSRPARPTVPEAERRSRAPERDHRS